MFPPNFQCVFHVSNKKGSLGLPLKTTLYQTNIAFVSILLIYHDSSPQILFVTVLYIFCITPTNPSISINRFVSAIVPFCLPLRASLRKHTLNHCNLYPFCSVLFHMINDNLFLVNYFFLFSLYFYLIRHFLLCSLWVQASIEGIIVGVFRMLFRIGLCVSFYFFICHHKGLKGISANSRTCVKMIPAFP